MLKQNPNRWPQVKQTALKQRLDGKVSVESQQPDLEILTEAERAHLAEAMRAGAAAGYPFTPKDWNGAVTTILEWRQLTNRAGILRVCLREVLTECKSPW